LKVVSIIGARPQFIKAAPLSKTLRSAGHQEILVHTGQHYDSNMSEVFFEQLGIPEPDINLGIGSRAHGAQTGAMLTAIEGVLLRQNADWTIVYGDTNSTLAGALAAAKLVCPVAHVEAGLRSFNRSMPEEINRIVADHVSTLLLCPSKTAVGNLAAEGISQNVHLVGDVMYDAVLQFSERARQKSDVLKSLQLEPGAYLLATVHRPENTDDPIQLKKIFDGFAALEERIIFPVHPRTQEALRVNGVLKSLANSDKHPISFGERIKRVGNIEMIEPVGYLDSLMLQQNARMILTDSGGMQKEAYWLGIPCVTLRNETEWIETVEAGWNVLTGAETARIVAAVTKIPTRGPGNALLYGDGHAAERCVEALSS
jgi:UDP-GlcNAc3NAcA epimerase